MENSVDPFENFRVPLIDRENLRYIDDDESYFLCNEERGSCYGLIMNNYSNSENKENSRSNKSSLRKSLSTGDLRVKHEKKAANFKQPHGTKRMLSSPNTPNKKFISLAQKVNAFHFKTPDRYKTNMMQPKLQFHPSQRTEMPKTPNLRTKTRYRPPVNVLSQKEQEDLIVEEMKKNQFKATEINQGILNGSQLRVKVEKKPNTKPEPFNLTEVKHSLPKIEEPSHKFVANPLPEKILKHVVGVKPHPAKPPTIPKTPNFKIKSKPQTVEPRLQSPEVRSVTKSEVKPFSFISRDMEMLQKKEEKIQKFLEEEKKAREFKANPLPKYLNKNNKSADSLSIPSTSSSKDESQTEIFHFKARPAVVLHKKPFEPKKSETVIEVKPFALSLDQRLEKRHQFEEKLKTTEMITSELKQKQEEQERIKEEVNIRQLRKNLVHKAKPVQIKPFIPKQVETNVTIPMTPPILKRHK